nr:MAG TPA: hypothetical protein [Caudoviricetes sp.]
MQVIGFLFASAVIPKVSIAHGKSATYVMGM